MGNGAPLQTSSPMSVRERKKRDPSRSIPIAPRTEAISISSGSEGETSQMTQLAAPRARTNVSVTWASSFSSSCVDIISRHCWYMDAIE